MRQNIKRFILPLKRTARSYPWAAKIEMSSYAPDRRPRGRTMTRRANRPLIGLVGMSTARGMLSEGGPRYPKRHDL
jgi:hypothetical protein